MEAERLPGGSVKLLIKPPSGVTPPAYDGFDHMGSFLAEAPSGLGHKQHEFPERVGITFEEADSLWDELFLVRYDLLGTRRPLDASTGRLDGGTKEVRMTGTAWDGLPKIEAELLPDGRQSLTLARGEFSILANCVDVAVEGLGAKSSRVEREEFRLRMGMTPEEAEPFRDELRRFDR